MYDVKQLQEQLRPLRVLYVEDEKELHDSTRHFLSRFFDTVDDAYNGVEGLKLFNQNDYDIVIADLLMPMMKGSEMIKKMNKIRPNLFYAVITGTNSEELPVEYINYRIEKPINIIEMIEFLKSIAHHFEEYKC